MIAAGTGLGEAGLIWDGERYHALATEGSHSDFGPRSRLQVDLYAFLARRDSRVSYEGLTDRDPVCLQALDLMVSIYGAEAGNLALRLLATGGIYIGGGIAPHILPKLLQNSFLDSFMAKGRFRAMLERIPVHVILNERAGLFGAARIARGDPPHIHRA